MMTIREKIAARNAERKTGDGLNKSLLRMAGIIFVGYWVCNRDNNSNNAFDVEGLR